MDTATFYRLLADGLLLMHVLFVAFVVLGLILILLGKLLSWGWVRNPYFRWLHIAGIGIVVLESWLGVICPLTTWEMVLRQKAGGATYAGSFIAHWLDSVLYYQAPWWIFTLAYSIFGSLVLAAWFWVRPRRFERRTSS